MLYYERRGDIIEPLTVWRNMQRKLIGIGGIGGMTIHTILYLD